MPKPNGRILIIDDEPALLKMMSVYLSRLGFEVETSGDTEEAGARVAAEPEAYSIVVLDATMTGLPMQDLAIDMLRRNPSLRVVAASGYPADMTEIEAAAPGRAAFLPKPFPPEMLASLLRGMLAAQEEEL